MNKAVNSKTFSPNPSEGWLPLSALLLFTIALPTIAEVNHFYRGGWLFWIDFLLLTTVVLLLAKRGVSGRWALFLVLWMALLAALIILIPLNFSLIWRAGWSTFAADSENGWLLLTNQLQSIWRAGPSLFWRDRLILSGGVLFFLGPALLLLYWIFYRWQRPLLGVLVCFIPFGIIRSFNPTDTISLFATIVIGLGCGAIWKQMIREKQWETTKTDYSENIRVTNGVAAVTVAIILVFGAGVLPAIPYRDIARSIQDALTFDRGLVTPFSGEGSTAGRPNSGEEEIRPANSAPRDTGPTTFLPTSYLLDGAPDLADTPVFEATIDGLPADPTDFHWQTATFDEYSGFGWARTREYGTDLEAGTVWRDRLVDPNEFQIRQTITWLGPPQSNFLITGQLQRINQPVTVFERFEGDVVRLQPTLPDVLPSYTAIATTRTVDPAILNAADYSRLAEQEFYRRYTRLPDNISERVIALAAEITADATGPYDQARALEAHLRTYEYSLDIEAPPEGREPVDYFLFDLQRGYCDYYATSMIVMARSLGLPARLGVGFNTVTPDENGRIIVTRDRGHSWAEIYFPEVGWVEFEPTASFPTSADIVPVSRPEQAVGTDFGDSPTGFNAPQGAWLWFWVIAAASGIVSLYFFWWPSYRGLPAEISRQMRRGWAARGDEWAQVREYARRSGYSGSVSATPREFLDSWRRFLNEGRPFGQLVDRFATLLEKERYGPGLNSEEKGALRRLAKQFRRRSRIEN